MMPTFRRMKNIEYQIPIGARINGLFVARSRAELREVI